MKNFQTFFESHDLMETYYHQLDVYLKSARGWRIAPITSEVQDGLVSEGSYNIIDDTGKTLGRDRLIGKIKREYDTSTDTLVFEHISAAFDETGLKRIRGLGIMDSVYPFDVKFVEDHNITRVAVDPVNTVTKQKFLKHFGASFDVDKSGSTWIATRKETA